MVRRIRLVASGSGDSGADRARGGGAGAGGATRLPHRARVHADQAVAHEDRCWSQGNCLRCPLARKPAATQLPPVARGFTASPALHSTSHVTRGTRSKRSASTKMRDHDTWGADWVSVPAGQAGVQGAESIMSH